MAMNYIKQITLPRVDDPILNRALQMIDEEFDKIARVINSYLSTSTGWDPGSIADGDEEAKELPVTGAKMGDFAIASFSLDVQDLVLDAQVTTADSVTAILANNTGGAIDLGSGTLYVRVIKK